MNSVILQGRLTAEPELRTTPNGKTVMSFNLAVRRDQETVDFVACTAFGKTAETIATWCEKGGRITVQGQLRVDQWQDKDGNKRYKTYVWVAGIDIIDFKGKTPKKPDDFREEREREEIKRKLEVEEDIEISEDDLPF